MLSRRARWAVPGGAVAAVAAAVAVSAITVAQAAPALPSRTPAELLAAVAGHTSPPPPLTGTVVETASLGVPELPGAANPDSITSLLAGSHTLRVWYASPTRLRLSMPVTLGESDLIRNGSTAWLWQSDSDSVMKIEIPAEHDGAAGDEPSMPSKAPLTPQQAARQALAIAGPSTRVTTESNVMIAGQPAYQLVIAPKDSRSLIGKITIALDGAHLGVPLRVQIFARGASTPAFQVGYTSISFVTPSAANFQFTPPPGAKVHTVGLLGHAWSGLPPQQQMRGEDGDSMMGTQVIGKNWLSVAVLPGSALAGLSGAGNAAGVAGSAARSVSGQSGGGPGENAAIMSALLKSASPVHGAWGSGQLLRTSLVSMLITKGHVLVGAVAPEVLYSAAAQVK